ncbi:hypothetical protein RvY_13165 [Ramazzottius varieornatus]|uniref:Uncharacterized protein n=1 Tax=Ramazzottius varieornatus TaxID=947166 RepID=A0A1D1VLZ2_RAMVA|nr:hypothetical protein RvY_13165 [Ramazzottius varieornatus]
MAYYRQGGPQMNSGARPHQGDMFPGVSQGDFGVGIELDEAPSFEAHHVHFHNEHFEPQGTKAQNIPAVHRDNKAALNLQPTPRQTEYFTALRDVSDEVSHAEFRPMQDSESSVAQFSRYPMKNYSMNTASSKLVPAAAPVILQEIAAQPEPGNL